MFQIETSGPLTSLHLILPTPIIPLFMQQRVCIMSATNLPHLVSNVNMQLMASSK